MRKLEYTLCRTYRNTPLVTLDSPLGSGHEITPDALRTLADALLDIAEQGEKQDLCSKHYRTHKGVVQF